LEITYKKRFQELFAVRTKLQPCRKFQELKGEFHDSDKNLKLVYTVYIYKYTYSVSPGIVSAVLVFPSHKNSAHVLVRCTAIWCGKEIFSSAPGWPYDPS
jgi:hypothetical protein